MSDHKPRLVAPTGFQVKGENSQRVKVSWGRVYGALGYNIYRADKENGTYNKIKVINGNIANSYIAYDTTVTPGKQYYYRVCAFGKNVSAIYTSKQSVRPLPLQAKLTAKKKSSKIKLSLKTADGAKNFRIYTSLDGKKYKLVKTLKNKKKYTLKKPKKVKKLYIKVRAYVTYNGKKYYGAYSKAKKIK